MFSENTLLLFFSFFVFFSFSDLQRILKGPELMIREQNEFRKYKNNKIPGADHCRVLPVPLGREDSPG